ncbi:hypothetical protein PX554_17330 [Sphingomonas sp. H39-1-10]|uniref:hypothetical protein n=1 Tax=Sphingomonas TaxID=13687 RepID=UPI00088118BD|nr:MULTISPECIES: hypothetical protein [Sphingomonas]MDF0489900.1 hypothetical protein [Sphingomonas pollutisoli]SDA32268.1 hypothetical protein SAMN03159340_02764 [Sphingomonas sp. NFR15]
MIGQSLTTDHALPRAWPAPLARGQRLLASAGSRPSFFYWVYVLLIITNIASPKAGIEVYGYPLTFGYMLLAVVAPIGLIGLARRPTLSAAAIGNFVAYLAVGFIGIYKTILYGAAQSSVVLAVALFIALPAIMLIALCAHLEYLTEKQIGTVLRWSMRFVIVWGLLNFVMFILFKHIIEIRYITINAGELSSVFNKNNRRGALMKLISTYNNGNIFGACMVMLAPVYIYFEKSRAWVIAFLLSVVLSLSRSTWFGLIMVGMFMAMSGQVRLSRFSFWIAAFASLALALYMMVTLGWSSDSLFDTDLGGRIEQWTTLTLSPFGESTFRIAEILYAGLLRSFGVIGFLIALVALVYPVGYALGQASRLSTLRRAAAAGCAGYLLVSFFDAAFIYPPTIVIYLFVSSLVYRRGFRLPSGEPLRGVPAR